MRTDSRIIFYVPWLVFTKQPWVVNVFHTVIKEWLRVIVWLVYPGESLPNWSVVLNRPNVAMTTLATMGIKQYYRYS